MPGGLLNESRVKSRAVVFQFDRPLRSRINDQIKVVIRLFKSSGSLDGKAEPLIDRSVFKLLIKRIVLKRDKMADQAAVQCRLLLNLIEREIVVPLRVNRMLLCLFEQLGKRCVLIDL